MLYLRHAGKRSSQLSDEQGLLAAGSKGSGAKHEAEWLARSEAQASLNCILLRISSKDTSIMESLLLLPATTLIIFI